MKNLSNRFRNLLTLILLFVFGAVYSNGIGSNGPGDDKKVEKDVQNTELITFSVFKHGDIALLNWSTTSELKNEGFELQRSSDGERWESIAFIEGQRKSLDYVDYQFIDKDPHTGTSVYRIKQHNYNGISSYTDLKHIKFAPITDIDEVPMLATASPRSF